jgi:hypothetical protein
LIEDGGDVNDNDDGGGDDDNARMTVPLQTPS